MQKPHLLSPLNITMPYKTALASSYIGHNSGLSKSENKPTHVQSCSKLNIRYAVPDYKDEMARAKQAKKFFTPDESADSSMIKTVLPRVTPFARQQLDSINASASIVLPSPNKVTRFALSQSQIKFPSRDVSYMFDYLKPLCTKTTVEAEKEELMNIMGISLDASEIQQKMPENIEELNSVSKEISMKEIENGPKKMRLLLKNDMFKNIPTEFYEKCPKFLKEIFSHTQQRDFKLARGSDFGINKFNLGGPASRYEALALLKWMDNIIENIEKTYGKNETENEKFDLTQIVYYICFREVIRQVSVQCVERGVLIWKLWKSYLSLVTEMADEIKKKTLKLKKDHEERIYQLHEYHDAEIAELNKNTEEMRADFEAKLKDAYEKIIQNEKARDLYKSDSEQNKQKADELEKNLSETACFREKYYTAKGIIVKLKSELAQISKEISENSVKNPGNTIEKLKHLETLEEANDLMNADKSEGEKVRKNSETSQDSESPKKGMKCQSTQTPVEAVSVEEKRYVEIPKGKREVRNIAINTMSTGPIVGKNNNPAVFRAIAVSQKDSSQTVEVMPTAIAGSQSRAQNNKQILKKAFTEKPFSTKNISIKNPVQTITANINSIPNNNNIEIPDDAFIQPNTENSASSIDLSNQGSAGYSTSKFGARRIIRKKTKGSNSSKPESQESAKMTENENENQIYIEDNQEIVNEGEYYENNEEPTEIQDPDQPQEMHTVQHISKNSNGVIRSPINPKRYSKVVKKSNLTAKNGSSSKKQAVTGKNHEFENENEELEFPDPTGRDVVQDEEEENLVMPDENEENPDYFIQNEFDVKPKPQKSQPKIRKVKVKKIVKKPVQKTIVNPENPNETIQKEEIIEVEEEVIEEVIEEVKEYIEQPKRSPQKIMKNAVKKITKPHINGEPKNDDKNEIQYENDNNNEIYVVNAIIEEPNEKSERQEIQGDHTISPAKTQRSPQKFTLHKKVNNSDPNPIYQPQNNNDPMNMDAVDLVTENIGDNMAPIYEHNSSIQENNTISENTVQKIENTNSSISPEKEHKSDTKRTDLDKSQATIKSKSPSKKSNYSTRDITKQFAEQKMYFYNIRKFGIEN